MTQSIQLTISEDKLKVVTPYNEGFVAKCRNLRGKFQGGAWWFDDSIIDYVREAMIMFYGTTGEVPFENCTLFISDFSGSEFCGPVTLFGRTVARAAGRDSGARLGDDIILIKGSCGSGGSVKNWKTEVINASFEMKNFPIPSLDLAEVKAAIEAGWCEVRYSKKKRDPEVVKAEIEMLKAKIAELEVEL